MDDITDNVYNKLKKHGVSDEDDEDERKRKMDGVKDDVKKDLDNDRN